jgi:hypothetical protein
MPTLVESVYKAFHILEHDWFSVQVILVEIASKVVYQNESFRKHLVRKSLVEDCK